MLERHAYPTSIDYTDLNGVIYLWGASTKMSHMPTIKWLSSIEQFTFVYVCHIIRMVRTTTWCERRRQRQRIESINKFELHRRRQHSMTPKPDLESAHLNLFCHFLLLFWCKIENMHHWLWSGWTPVTDVSKVPKPSLLWHESSESTICHQLRVHRISMQYLKSILFT